MALANRGGLPEALGAGGVQTRLPAGRGLYTGSNGRNSGVFTRAVAHGRRVGSPTAIAVSAALTTDRVIAAKRQPLEQKVSGVGPTGGADGGKAAPDAPGKVIGGPDGRAA